MSDKLAEWFLGQGPTGVLALLAILALLYAIRRHDKVHEILEKERKERMSELRDYVALIQENTHVLNETNRGRNAMSAMLVDLARSIATGIDKQADVAHTIQSEVINKLDRIELLLGMRRSP